MLGPRVVEGAIEAAVEGVLGKSDAAFWLSPPLTEMGTNAVATQTKEVSIIFEEKRRTLNHLAEERMIIWSVSSLAGRCNSES